MANLKKKILGSVSGGLGDIVFRERNGVNVLALRPTSFNAPNDPASIARRGKFTMAVKLSTAIGSQPKLKALWKIMTPAGITDYNYLVKSNYNYVTADSPGTLIQIAPGGSFPVTVNTVNIASNQISININRIGENAGIDPAAEVKLQMLGLLFNSNPIVENAAPYIFFSFSSDTADIVLTDPVDIISPFNGSQSLIVDQYQDHKLYFILATLNAEGNIINYSVTLRNN